MFWFGREVVVGILGVQNWAGAHKSGFAQLQLEFAQLEGVSEARWARFLSLDPPTHPARSFAANVVLLRIRATTFVGGVWEGCWKYIGQYCIPPHSRN